MQKSVVSIVKGTDPEKIVGEALDLIGGVKNLIRPGSTVVVKPNAGHPWPPETSVCTSPEVVAATIKEVRKAGPKQIILAEAAAIGCDTMQCFEVTGIGKAAEDAGVDKIIDIKREKDLIKIPIRDAWSDIKSVLLPRFLLEADHLVNVPIVKPNPATIITLCLKNIKGVVQDKVHYQMHQTNLIHAMLDLWTVCKADLQIVDCIRPGEGFGPHNTLQAEFGCVVAGKDPLAVDITTFRMIGLDIDLVKWYMGPARERGLGQFEDKDIEIRGRTIKEVFKPLWIPYDLRGFHRYPEYNIYSEGACSSCIALMVYTMEKLKALGEYDKHAGATIVIGRPKELPKGVPIGKLFLVGDCTKKFRDQGIWAGGCCPTEAAPIWAIVDGKAYENLEDYPFDIRKRHTEEMVIMQEHTVRMKEKWDKEQRGKEK
jgi:uncharacterized protein (DUF362 family)